MEAYSRKGLIREEVYFKTFGIFIKPSLHWQALRNLEFANKSCLKFASVNRMKNLAKLVCESLDMHIIDKVVCGCLQELSHSTDRWQSCVWVNFDNKTKWPKEPNQTRTGATKKCGKELAVFINGNKRKCLKGTWY